MSPNMSTVWRLFITISEWAEREGEEEGEKWVMWLVTYYKRKSCWNMRLNRGVWWHSFTLPKMQCAQICIGKSKSMTPWVIGAAGTVFVLHVPLCFFLSRAFWTRYHLRSDIHLVLGFGRMAPLSLIILVSGSSSALLKSFFEFNLR